MPRRTRAWRSLSWFALGIWKENPPCCLSPLYHGIREAELVSLKVRDIQHREGRKCTVLDQMAGFQSSKERPSISWPNPGSFHQ